MVSCLFYIQTLNHNRRVDQIEKFGLIKFIFYPYIKAFTRNEFIVLLNTNSKIQITYQIKKRSGTNLMKHQFG